MLAFLRMPILIPLKQYSLRRLFLSFFLTDCMPDLIGSSHTLLFIVSIPRMSLLIKIRRQSVELVMSLLSLRLILLRGTWIK